MPLGTALTFDHMIKRLKQQRNIEIVMLTFSFVIKLLDVSSLYTPVLV